MTGTVPALQVAGAADLPEVERLLEAAGLTRDGLADCERDGQLLVARADDGCLMGCVAAGDVRTSRRSSGRSRSRPARAATAWEAPSWRTCAGPRAGRGCARSVAADGDGGSVLRGARLGDGRPGGRSGRRRRLGRVHGRVPVERPRDAPGPALRAAPSTQAADDAQPGQAGPGSSGRVNVKAARSSPARATRRRGARRDRAPARGDAHGSRAPRPTRSSPAPGRRTLSQHGQAGSRRRTAASVAGSNAETTARASVPSA